MTTWLFPTAAGQATLDPVKITVPGGFFSADVDLQSEPLSIEVQPLPAGAPADFNGAVGQFQLSATPDRTSTRLGEPVTLRVELRGNGNWGTLGDPVWPSDKQWRIFNNKTDSQSKVVNGALTGARVYEQLFTPLSEGQLTLPAITYSYFDPVTQQYQMLSTDALTIDVTAGNPNLAVSLPKGQTAAPANDQAAAPALALKPAPQTLMSEAQPLTQQPLFGLLFIIPVGLVAGELAVSARKHYLTANAARLRRSRALKHAQRRLKRARRSKNVQIETGRIVLKYLEDQIQTPLTGLSHSTLAQLLQTHISSALIARVIAALFVGEVSEYSQAKPQTNKDVIKNTGRLLEDLEQEWTA
ncbi:MAG: protein BatD [Chloroflexi bacterium]|nr:protein BatD [Chloroflexota bacterium]